MKKSELVFSLLAIPVDAAMVVLAFLLAYEIRTNAEVIYILPLADYLRFVLSLLPVWILVFGLEGLYAIRSMRRGFDELASIFISVSLGVLLVTAAIFLTNTQIGSRIVLLYAYLFAFLFVLLGRWLLRQVQRSLYQYGVGTRRVLIIGANDTAYQLAREMTRRPALGCVYLGYIATATSRASSSELGRKLGAFSELASIIETHRPDEIILADPQLPDGQFLALLALTNQQRVDLRITPNLVGIQTTHVTFSSMAGVPLVEFQRTKLQGWGRIVKRAVDAIGAVVGILLFSPFMLLTALAVRLTSAGPIIYYNERVGQDKRHFWTYKFRTMRQEYCTGDGYGGAKAMAFEQELIAKQNTRQGAIYKVGNDPRLTPIGEFLRKSSLDELPQFFNVLFGHMSLVGPRPHQPREVAKYEPWQEKLFTVKPGITGLAQISGRSDLDFEDEARLDISYIEHWSFWQDVRIILKTPISIIQSRSRKAA